MGSLKRQDQGGFLYKLGSFSTCHGCHESYREEQFTPKTGLHVRHPESCLPADEGIFRLKKNSRPSWGGHVCWKNALRMKGWAFDTWNLGVLGSSSIARSWKPLEALEANPKSFRVLGGPGWVARLFPNDGFRVTKRWQIFLQILGRHSSHIHPFRRKTAMNIPSMSQQAPPRTGFKDWEVSDGASQNEARLGSWKKLRFMGIIADGKKRLNTYFHVKNSTIWDFFQGTLEMEQTRRRKWFRTPIFPTWTFRNFPTQGCPEWSSSPQA